MQSGVINCFGMLAKSIGFLACMTWRKVIAAHDIVKEWRNKSAGFELSQHSQALRRGPRKNFSMLDLLFLLNKK